MRDLNEVYPALVTWLNEAIENELDHIDEYDCMVDVRPVEARSRDGYIAHTNGGVAGTLIKQLQDYESATGEEQSIIEPYYNSAVNDAAQAFIEDREELAEQWENKSCERGPDSWLWELFYSAELAFEKQQQLPTMEQSFYATSVGRLREEYLEYHYQYINEGGAYFIQCTALFYEADNHRNVTGEDEVYIFAGINTDFEYGRERGLQTTAEGNYKIKDLTADKVDDIVEDMIKSTWRDIDA